MPARAGAATAALMPGTISVRDTGGLQRQRFLGSAAEHERVATLQSDDPSPLCRGGDHRVVNRRLRRLRPAGALADEHVVGALGQRQDGGRDQRVVEHEVGLPQTAGRLEREMVGIARPGADERHEAGGRQAHEPAPTPVSVRSRPS